MGLGHGFFLTRFSLREDYENILKKGHGLYESISFPLDLGSQISGQ